MDTVLLFFILTLLAVVVVLLLAVVDHVRVLQAAVAPEEAEQDPQGSEQGSAEATEESETSASAQAPAETIPPESAEAAPPAEPPDAHFGSLVGKRLWDAMTGKPVPGAEPEFVASLKGRYQLVLTKHIQQLFMEGAEHGRANHSKVPSNRAKVSGVDGFVPSWIPQQHADSIYQAGFDSASVTEKNLEDLRGRFAEVCDTLFNRTELEPRGQTLARRLVVLPGEVPLLEGVAPAADEVPAPAESMSLEVPLAAPAEREAVAA